MAQRYSGVLCHPTSFPAPHGIGDLGDAAFRFVDWLALAAQRLWQILPLTPPGPGNSPYASPSAFAGNPLLVSLSWLAGDGLLERAAIDNHPPFPDYAVDYPAVEAWKLARLRDAFSAFRRGAAADQRQAFDAFRAEAAGWLDDYALFMALKAAYGGAGWLDWDAAQRRREPAALDAARAEHADEIRFHQFVQFQFRRQWRELRRYANERDIRIVGDLPIFVAHDSADVWANQHLFRLDPEGRPLVVAGVPPDAFTDQGQLWGNPHYDWGAHAGEAYAWWTARVRASLDLVDLLRIDHFRGFAAAWVVPADAPTAATGRWEEGPKSAIFEAMRGEFGELPFIVEDLGVVTDDVVELRETLVLPGMKILQFAFGSGADNAYLPHTYEPGCVVYPATHDNQTTIGWFATLPEWQRQDVQRYLGKDGGDIAWDLIRLALASVAEMAVLPLQDVMRLGDEARMNTPGRAEGNWGWRYEQHMLHPGLGAGLAELVTAYGRRPPRTEDRGRDPFDYTAPNAAHRLHTAADPWSG